MRPAVITSFFTVDISKRWIGAVIITLIINLHPVLGWAAPGKDSLGVRTVIIDPGHGGKDPGCLGSHSHEADVALDISLKLGKMIEDKYGSSVNVIYTRTTDKFVDLAERAKMANRYKGDLFICIHANSGQPSAKGSEVYVLGLHKEDAQFKVAQKENASILMEDNYEAKYENFNPNDPDDYIIMNHIAKTYLNNSIKLANYIETYLKSTPKIVNRGVKQAGFLVLHQVNMPSVLVETAFLTNREEEILLNDSTSQRNIAKAVFDAFVDYKTDMDKLNTEMGQTVINTQNSNSQSTQEKPKDKPPVNVVTPKDPDPVVVNDEKDKIYFKVQIAASTKPIDLTSNEFKGLSPVEENKVSANMFRYTYGKTPKFEEAVKFQAVAREKGFSTAFVTAYQNGERIDMNKALQVANK